MRQHRVVLDDNAVHVTVVVHLARIGRRVARPPGVLIVVCPAREHRIPIAEPVVDLQGRDAVARAGRKLAVVRGGERVALRQTDDLHGAQVVVLVRAEKVRPVQDDRTSDGAADPGLAEIRLGTGGKVVRCVERLVAAEIGCRAAEGVAARLGHDRNHGGQRGSVLGVELVAEHLEFLHRVLRDVDRRVPPDCIVDVSAVDDRGVAVALIGRAAELDDRELLPEIVRSGAGHQLRQREEVPGQHRQRRDLFGDHHRGGLRLGDLDQRRLRHDGQRLRERRHGESEVEVEVRADCENHFALLRREPGQLDRNRVRRRLKRRGAEVTAVGGDEDLADAVRLVDDGDGRARQRAAGVVRHRPADAAAGHLGAGRRDRRRQQHQCGERCRWRET